ncbi:phage integrase Arm DNA-binding domain-containing protein [Pantoea sp. GD03673]|uniref:phage integrase Arm DNA-binding domain-containing protein n=1 Tax=Pantoea sp. GD03673 TaxID=2975364 RepID=UPI00244A004C|nr:phage integrase Arm DNA-binding domain-containing protein [Pantoea sp. GD03673]MDH2066859.1 phage integrase Arm DNA-binding domain-containing protein [Pantoea sp. GD03673]
MARPRKYNVTIPGLSCFTDVRTKRVYWRFKHPVTGKFHGLGTDEAEAKAIAIEANTRLAENAMKNMVRVRDCIAETVNHSITVTGWSERYIALQSRRLGDGDIKQSTFKVRRLVSNLLASEMGIKGLDLVTVRDIHTLMESYINQGKCSMANTIRSVAGDFFREAQLAGEFNGSFNPALATRVPKIKVMRSRLDMNKWRDIYDIAISTHYIQRAMLLAVITGQRSGDISKMKFSDIWDDHLHVEQQKTGVKIAIPLSLRCDELRMSLRDVISQCRDKILSPYIIHHHHDSGHAKRGGQVHTDSLGMHFRIARDASGISWGEKTPPTFHEQRSLSERLYRAQGIDTKTLLGHSSQKMTDKYNDDRNSGWKMLAI